MDIALAREVEKTLHKLIQSRILTDEDLMKISLIFANRIEQLQKETDDNEK